MLDRLRKVGRLSNYDKGPLDRIAAKIRLPLDRAYNERIIPDVRKLSAAGAHPDGAGREEFFIEHLWVFSPMSLQRLAACAAFEVHGLRRLREPSGKYTVDAFLTPAPG